MLSRIFYIFTLVLINTIESQSKMDIAKRDFIQRRIQSGVGRPYLKAYETLTNRVIKKVSDIDPAADENLIRQMAYELKCSFQNIHQDLNQASRHAVPIRESLENDELNILRQLKRCEDQVKKNEAALEEAKKNLESTQKLIDESQKAIEDAKKGAEDAENRVRLAQEANQQNQNCNKKRRRRSFSMCSLFGYWSVKGTDNVHQRLSMAFHDKHQAEYRLVQRQQVGHTQRARYNQAESQLALATRQLKEIKDRLVPIQTTQKHLAEFTTNMKTVETFINEVFGASKVLKEELINLLDFQNIIEPLADIYDKMAKDQLLGTVKITIIHPTEAKVTEIVEKLKTLLNASWALLIDDDPKHIKPHCATMKNI